jgi:16S rRNA (uracil1498-N3)-methyltransferase
MRIPRIFQPGPLSSGQTLEPDARAATHLTRVLRLRVGDALVVFNGEGGEFAARICELGRRTLRVEVGGFVNRERESPLELILLQGVSRGERMDYTVQKAVELGVSRIVPVRTERTVVNLKGDRQARRREHWQAVVHAACEQCGRNRVPTVAPVMDLSPLLGEQTVGLKLVLHHRADTVLQDIPRPAGPVTLLIGPEGGLSAAEIAKAEAAGFVALRLGPRVMRTETAVLTTLAVLQWHWGDLGEMNS